MTPITLFSWGYWGWGNATQELVKLADVVERDRGFDPPVFVDVRYSRSVRAIGFRDKAFQELLGKRYRWIRGLGNRAIASHTGPKVQIHDPDSVKELLDLAGEMAGENRRVIFFCACEYPYIDGEPHCHRVAIGDLLLKKAKDTGVAVEVVEWPGGEPTALKLDVAPKQVKDIHKGRTTLVLDEKASLAKFGGLAWGSTVELHSEAGDLVALCGPAKYQQGWVLPIIDWWSLPLKDHDEPPDLKVETRELRRNLGMETRSIN